MMIPRIVESLSARKSSRGFTLIELLVVVAIIALLISILMPSLTKARSRARGAVCLSNVRQFAMANTTYAAGSDGLLITNNATSFYAGNSTYANWYSGSQYSSPYQYRFGIMVAYSGTKGTPFICPEMVALNTKNFSGSSLPVSPTATPNLPECDYGYAEIATNRYQSIESPTGTVAFMDSAEFIQPAVLGDSPYIYSPIHDVDGGISVGGWFHGRHNGTGAVSFYDGHAEMIAPTIVPTPADTTSIGTYAMHKSMNLGSLLAGPIDASHANDVATAYLTYVSGNPSYYFWYSKSNRQ